MLTVNHTLYSKLLNQIESDKLVQSNYVQDLRLSLPTNPNSEVPARVDGFHLARHCSKLPYVLLAVNSICFTWLASLSYGATNLDACKKIDAPQPFTLTALAGVSFALPAAIFLLLKQWDRIAVPLTRASNEVPLLSRVGTTAQKIFTFGRLALPYFVLTMAYSQLHGLDDWVSGNPKHAFPYSTFNCSPAHLNNAFVHGVFTAAAFAVGNLWFQSRCRDEVAAEDRKFLESLSVLKPDVLVLLETGKAISPLKKKICSHWNLAREKVIRRHEMVAQAIQRYKIEPEKAKEIRLLNESLCKEQIQIIDEKAESLYIVARPKDEKLLDTLMTRLYEPGTPLDEFKEGLPKISSLRQMAQVPTSKSVPSTNN